MTEETVHESTATRSRTAIASYLRRVADALDEGGPVPVDHEETVTVDPSAEPDLGVEVERGDGTVEFEIGIEWPEGDGGVDVGGAARGATFELYRDRADEWRWRLRHDNGNIVADSGEGYGKKSNAVNGLESVRKNAPGAEVEEL